MKIGFVTGNIGKFEEVRDSVGKRIEIIHIRPTSLLEIQSLDSREIALHKLTQVMIFFKLHKDIHGIVVEDTSLTLGSLDFKLPGPFIAWYLQELKVEGIAKMATLLGDTRAINKTVIGLVMRRLRNGSSPPILFEGECKGRIVPPRGTKDFGWGSAFEVDGTGNTYGEMEPEIKSRHSARAIAARKLRGYLLDKV